MGRRCRSEGLRTAMAGVNSTSRNAPLLARTPGSHPLRPSTEGRCVSSSSSPVLLFSCSICSRRGSDLQFRVAQHSAWCCAGPVRPEQHCTTRPPPTPFGLVVRSPWNPLDRPVGKQSPSAGPVGTLIAWVTIPGGLRARAVVMDDLVMVLRGVALHSLPGPMRAGSLTSSSASCGCTWWWPAAWSATQRWSWPPPGATSSDGAPAPARTVAQQRTCIGGPAPWTAVCRPCWASRRG